MMFIKLLAILVLPLLAVATPWGATTTTKPPVTTTVTVTATSTPTGTSCSTGPVQCCNSVESSSNPLAILQLALDGIILDLLDGIEALVGFTCSPITVVGGGGTDCSGQTVCCENDNFNGLVALGCAPINLNL